GVAVVVLDVVRRLAAVRAHRADVGGHPGLHVERLPRALVFVLGDAVRDLRRAALRGAVAGARQTATDIHEHEPDGTPDRHVGAEALTERVVAGIDPDLTRDRTIDDDERRDGMRRRL